MKETDPPAARSAGTTAIIDPGTEEVGSVATTIVPSTDSVPAKDVLGPLDQIEPPVSTALGPKDEEAPPVAGAEPVVTAEKGHTAVVGGPASD
jgi:hypothetical protein